MKKILSILLIITLVLTVTGCTEKEKKETDASKFKKEYESLNGTTREKDGKTIRTITIDGDNPFIYSNEDEIIKKMDNKETFVVYFGFTDCPWCRSIIEELITSAKEKGIKKIYYVNVKEIRDVKELDKDNNIKTVEEGTKGYKELIKRMENVLEDYKLTNEDEEEINVGEKRIYAPNIVVVKKGKAEEMESGNSEKQTDPYQELTKEMKKETLNKFKCLFKCLDESNTCKKNAC